VTFFGVGVLHSGSEKGGLWERLSMKKEVYGEINNLKRAPLLANMGIKKGFWDI